MLSCTPKFKYNKMHAIMCHINLSCAIICHVNILWKFKHKSLYIIANCFTSCHIFTSSRKLINKTFIISYIISLDIPYTFLSFIIHVLINMLYLFWFFLFFSLFTIAYRLAIFMIFFSKDWKFTNKWIDLIIFCAISF